MLTVDGRNVEIFPSNQPGAPLVVFHAAMGEGEAVFEAARSMTRADFSMAAVEILNWNDELSPWPQSAVARGDAPFSGGAADYLCRLTERIMPEVLAQLPAEPAFLALAGYSMAGLFTLYALTQTDRFARAASASGSLWFPGIVEYLQSHPPRRTPERLYLSLGDRESHTRNTALRPVEENTRQMAEWYHSQGILTQFEMNPGGHFKDADHRMARAIAWILGDAPSISCQIGSAAL